MPGGKEPTKLIAVVVHPNAETRTEAARVLAMAGVSTCEAADADEAIAACREHRADVLLAPHDLALVDRIKRDPDLFRVGLVLLADEFDVEELLEAIRHGADDVLRTPLDPAETIGRTLAAARRKALVKELTAQNQRLEELILFDELSGLRNRRAILHELDTVLAGARRHGHRLSVLMIDIDHFKPINDRYGHLVGDEVLRVVSRRLAGRLRQADVAGRLGGDELLVVLPDTAGHGAAIVARSITDAVHAEPVQTDVGPIEVTVSIGSAEWRDGSDVSTVLEAADGALYRAKAAGRDCAVAA